MNYQQPQQSQLPFEPTKCQSNPQQFNQAPFLPNNISIPPEMAGFVPNIAAMVANEASSNCYKNSGRMFLYNQLSANGYANTDYVVAVQTAVDMLLLGLGKNQYSHASQGLGDAVSKALIMCNAINFQKFPSLQQYVTPELYGDAVTMVNSIPSTQQQIMQVRSQISQPQQMMPSVMNNNMGNSFPQMNQPTMGGFQPSRMQPGMQSVNTSQVFRTPNQNQQVVNQPHVNQHTAGQFAQEGRYDHLRANAATIVQPAPAVLNTYPSSNRGTVNQPLVNQSEYFMKGAPLTGQIQAVEELQLVWKPSIAQWHPVTCNTLYEKILLKEVEWVDGNRYVVSMAVKLTGEEMEEAKHKIGYIDQAMMNTTPERYGSRREAIVDNIDSFVERNRVTREADVKPEEEVAAFNICNTERTTVPANFLSSAIFDGRVIMKKNLQQTENDLSAYGVNAIISTPVLVDDTQEKLLSQLGECTSFLRIQAVLKNALSGKNVSAVSKNLAGKIDKVFTREINSILNNRLSLDDKIDSFVSDAADLINFLKDKYGQMFADAYLSCQEDFVNTYLNQGLVDENLHSAMIANLRLEVDNNISNSKYVAGDVLPITFITQFYQLTYLQVQAADLSISQFSNVGTEVLLSANPELYKLAKEMFDEEDIKIIPVAHHLLITADNIVYEFHKGLINKEFVTISRFH